MAAAGLPITTAAVVGDNGHDGFRLDAIDMDDHFDLSTMISIFIERSDQGSVVLFIDPGIIMDQ